MPTITIFLDFLFQVRSPNSHLTQQKEILFFLQNISLKITYLNKFISLLGHSSDMICSSRTKIVICLNCYNRLTPSCKFCKLILFLLAFPECIMRCLTSNKEQRYVKVGKYSSTSFLNSTRSTISELIIKGTKWFFTHQISCM